MKKIKYFLVIVLVLVTVWMFLFNSSADTSWPEAGKTLTIIVNYRAGNSHDMMVRTLQPYLSDELGIDIIVENVIGASGLLGLRQVLNIPSDGYTWVTWSLPKHDTESVMTAEGKEPFYSFEDFIPIGSTNPDTHMIVVPADSPFNNMQELIDYAKDHPKELLFAGTGTYPGVSGIWEDIQDKTGAEFEFVPYGGGTPEVATAMLGGHADVATLGLTISYKNYVLTGKFKALAIASNVRNANAPDLPTIPEALGVELEEFTGKVIRIVMIKGDTPEAIIKRCQDAFKIAAENPEFIERYKSTGNTYEYVSPEEINAARLPLIEFFKTKL